MARTHATARPFLLTVAEVLQRGSGCELFYAHSLAWLQAAVGYDYALGRSDDDQVDALWHYRDGMPDIVESLWPLYHDQYIKIDPLRPARFRSGPGVGAFAVSRDATGPDAAVYSARFLLPLELRQQAVLHLRDAQSTVRYSFVLWRRDADQAFTRADFTMLADAQPLFESVARLNWSAESADDHQDRNALGHLTKRELEVLRLVAHGASNNEIADALQLGLATVKTHVVSIRRKTDARSRVDLVLLARRSLFANVSAETPQLALADLDRGAGS